jgi:hypothetical protein
MSQKDQTVPGITGKPVPKPRTAKQQHELEKKRRQRKHLGTNVGGTQYSSDVNPYYNPRQRTFREFVELAEGKKKDIKRLKSAYLAGQQQAEPKIVNIPAGEPNSPERAAAVKQLMQMSGGREVRKAKEKREREAKRAAKNILKQQQEGFSYGSKSYQQELEKKRKEKEEQRRTQAQQTRDQLYRERTRGRGIRAVHKGQSGWMKDGKFTPDT